MSAGIQRHKDVASADLSPLFNGDACDHAVIGMLHNLSVLRDLDAAAGDDRPRNIGQRRPGATGPKQHNQR